MTALFWINAGALAVGTLAGGAFLYRYMTQVKGWLADETMTHVVAFSGIVFLFYLLYAVRYVQAPSRAPGVDLTPFNIIRAVAFVALTLVVLWRWMIFERSVRRIRRIRPA